VTIQDLGSIGEFVAAIATLATLVYLAIQIRQNTRSIRTSAYQEASRDIAEAIDQLARDPELARIWYAGARDFESLPKEERFRFSLYLTAVMRRYENLLYQTEEIPLDPETWEGVRELMRQTFSQPGVTSWWKRSRGLFNRQLRDFIEHDL
jgi:hypothetical protein